MKYNMRGARFVTIVSKNHEEFFSRIIKSTRTDDPVASIVCRPYIVLCSVGQTVDAAIKEIERKFKFAHVDKYVIMPNHIHMILTLGCGDRQKNKYVELCQDKSMADENEPITIHALGTVVEDLKQTVSAEYGFPVWEENFDSVFINNADDYDRIAEYIDKNPWRWYNKYNLHGNPLAAILRAK